MARGFLPRCSDRRPVTGRGRLAPSGLQWLRKKQEGIHVAGAQQSEMPPVQGGQLSLPQTFRNGEHRSVDKADVRIGVSIANLVYARGVVGLQVDDADGSGDDALQKG